MPSRQKLTRSSLFVKILYLFLIFLSFYFLVVSRTGEVYTVWQASHPFFLLVYFAATLVLVAIIFSSEKLSHKLLFIILHSILSHSLFAIIFPAGDVGVQQVVLGITRRIYDSLAPHGYGHSPNILVQIYHWLRGINFQSVYSVLFARMFSVDVFWSHLFLMPALWGIFVPILSFATAKALGANDIASTLSSLVISVFPTTILWGAFSVPNSLGFLFAFASLYFCIKYVSSSKNSSALLLLVFSFASFISHFQTGIVVLAFVSLAVASRMYKNSKSKSPLTAKYLLATSFILSVSLLPAALVYHRLLSSLYAQFSLHKFYTLSASELIGISVIGEYFYYSPFNMLVNVSGPILGIIGIAYFLYRSVKKENGKKDSSLFFLPLAFLMVFIVYRILKLFMVGVPFRAERIWVYRDFILAPYLSILGYSFFLFLQQKKPQNVFAELHTFPPISKSSSKANLKSLAAYLFVILSISSWVTASLYYAYPHYGPLQTTSYELEAVRHIESTTNEKYVVIADQWIILAAQMFVGAYNSRAYYFAHTDPRGVTLFIEMKKNPTRDTMISAMEYNNSTIAFFVIEKPRLYVEEYERIVQEAILNGLQIYRTFEYQGEEKLHIFTYRK